MRLNRFFAAAAVLLPVLLLPLSIFADIVQLKDGRTLRGRIVAQDKETISLRSAEGDYLIYRDQMVRFFYDDSSILENQLERERARTENQPAYYPPPTAENPAQRPPVTGEPVLTPIQPRPQQRQDDGPVRHRLIVQLSGGAGSMQALYPEFFKEDKTADFLQQSISLTSSVSYPYEMSASRATTYAGGVYFETDRMAGGIEGFMAKNAGGFQLMESVTSSGRFYAGSGSFTENSISLYRLRPAVLLGSRDWAVQPFLFGGPMILEMKSRGNQTEVLTSAATLNSSAVYSPSISAVARAQGMGAGLEVRWLIGGLFELRARGGYASLKGSFKTSELRIPIQELAAYETGTAYFSAVDGAGKMRTTLTDIRGTFFFRAAHWMRVFVEYQQLSARNSIEGYGVIRLPDNAVVPGATVHADLYRTLGFTRNARVGTYRAGVEFSAF